METRLVAYFDLLGFSSIINSDNEENLTKQEKVLRLLSYLAANQGDYVSGASNPDDPDTGFYFKPASSAFSDNVIISAPINNEMFGIDILISSLTSFVAHFFHEALNIGCLIRGGITVGRLHHEKKVVFGPALVEAYKLESEVAKFPRIMISNSAMSQIDRHKYIQFDADDGYPCLDYLGYSFRVAPQMMDLTVDISASKPPLIASHGSTFSRTRWSYFEKIIKHGISDLEVSDNEQGLNKWRWLLARWERLECEIL